MGKEHWSIKYRVADDDWRWVQDGQFPSDILNFKSMKAAKKYAKGLPDEGEFKYIKFSEEEYD